MANHELIQRAKALHAKVGTPVAYCFEGPPNPDDETYSICNEGNDSHSCYATVVAREVERAQSVAEQIEEAFAIVAELARVVAAVDPVQAEGRSSQAPTTTRAD